MNQNQHKTRVIKFKYFWNRESLKRQRLEWFDLLWRADFRFFSSVDIKTVLIITYFIQHKWNFWWKVSFYHTHAKQAACCHSHTADADIVKKLSERLFFRKIHHLKSLNECKFIFRVPKNMFTLVIMLRAP